MRNTDADFRAHHGARRVSQPGTVAQMLLVLIAACGSHHDRRDNAMAGDNGMLLEPMAGTMSTGGTMSAGECNGAACAMEGDACSPFEGAGAFSLAGHRDDQQGSCNPACSPAASGNAACGFDSGADAAFLWTAPNDGWYVFELAGVDSAMPPPVLYLLDASCQGSELACAHANAVGPSGMVSRVLLNLTAGQALTAVGELAVGQSAARADGTPLSYALSIQQTDCAVESLAGQLPVDKELVLTESEAPLREITCNEGAVVAQVGARFTAPAAGTYEFELDYSQDAAILALYLDDCMGMEQGCRRVTADAEEPLILWVDLAAGQSVVAIMAVEQASVASNQLHLTVREAPVTSAP